MLPTKESHVGARLPKGVKTTHVLFAFLFKNDDDMCTKELVMLRLSATLPMLFAIGNRKNIFFNKHR